MINWTRMVFVYGTLKKGESNHRLLEKADFFGTGYLPRVRMLHLGGFPGLVAGGNKDVEGELYKITPEILASLDRLEGHPHFYTRRKVRVFPFADNEFATIAWCYFLSRDSQEHYQTTCPVIESGVWGKKEMSQPCDMI